MDSNDNSLMQQYFTDNSSVSILTRSRRSSRGTSRVYESKTSRCVKAGCRVCMKARRRVCMKARRRVCMKERRRVCMKERRRKISIQSDVPRLVRGSRPNS